MTKTGYFPGCSLHGTAIEYNESLQAVSQLFDLELNEIKDWNCCGATAAHSMNSMLGVALPARILALAENQNIDEFVVPCAACFSRIANAKHEMHVDEKYKSKVPEIIEMDYKGSSQPINVIDFIEKYFKTDLINKIVNPLNIKVACYYGCLLTRPPKLTKVERYEDPMMMEDIMKILGAEPIDWAFKTECCGAGFSVSHTESVARLSAKILEDAAHRGAEAIIVACPMCQSNLDMRRADINKYLGRNIDIPVLYISEAIGLALGIDQKKLGLNKHTVPFSFKKIAINEEVA